MNEKTKEVITNIYQYMIKKKSAAKINQQSITKELGISADNLCLEDIKNDLWDHIIDKIQYFNKDDLLFLAEYMREDFSARLYSVDRMDHFAEMNEIAIYIQKIVLNNETTFNKHSYINKARLDYLMECFMAYGNIKTKIEFSKRNALAISINNIFEPIEDEKVGEFFQGYNLYLNSTKIEDIEIESPKLRQYVASLQVTPDEIYKQANPVIEDIMGFHYDDVDYLMNNSHTLLRNTSCAYDTENRLHIKIKKTDFIDHFKDNINEKHLTKILEYLSINHCLSDGKKTNREVELRCITEEDGVLSFALRTFVECLGIFKRITITGHYMEEPTYSYQKEKLKKHNADLIKQQQSMSMYFSYVVAELFDKYGYLIAKDSNGYPSVDIKEITVNGSKLVFNDIDVLAFDKNTNTLLNCELKYFKVKMDYAGLTKDSLESEKYKSLLKRENILKDNKKAIVKEVFGLNIPEESISVKSIIITTRQNYNKREITEYNFEVFKQYLINKKPL